jgi:hypothetical protein
MNLFTKKGLILGNFIMRARIAMLILLISMLSACSPEKVAWESYGEEITDEGAMTMAEMTNTLPSDNIKFVGEISEVCQMKGCWMTLKTPEGQSVRVTFKDYGFFVPKDAAGRQVIIEGSASTKELDEEEAAHYAEDAGQTFDPDASRLEVAIVASGVLISPETSQL